MQILTVGGSRSDLSDLMSKLQQALVPKYFDSVTLTPCSGSSPTEADPSVITMQYGEAFIDLFIGNAISTDYIEVRGSVSGTGKVRENSISIINATNIITDIAVTDSGVALIGRYNGWAGLNTLIVIGKNADGGTCICAPVYCNSGEPWAINNFSPSIAEQSQNYLYSADLSAGKSPDDFTSVAMPGQRLTTTGTIIMSDIPTVNGKAFKGVYFPQYNPFSNHPEPFMFMMDGVSYAAIMKCNFIFRDGGE